MKGIGLATNARKLKNRVELMIVAVVMSYWLQLYHFRFLLVLHHWRKTSNLVLICI